MKRLRKGVLVGAAALLATLLVTASMAGIVDYTVPDSISVFCDEEPIGGSLATIAMGESVPTLHGSKSEATVKLFGFLPIKKIEVNSFRHKVLCPGGGVFGLRAPLDGVLVTAVGEVSTGDGVHQPAKAGGLISGDLITAVNGRKVTTATELSEAVENSGGQSLCLTVIRSGRELTVSVQPVSLGEGRGYRIGVFVRDSIAGIGTVTFIDPESGSFGGLGHGVYDGFSKQPVTLSRGVVTKVGLSGITRGAAGAPGELRGHLEPEKIGSLLSNTDCGVFGVLLTPPSEPAIPVGLRDDVRLGKAEILSTLENGVTERYTIEITDLRGERDSTKSFSVRITDPRLLEKTGGIVQGMSGSPIIQDGKLVGAVTHVLIGDPSRGYGIYIENMLSAAEGAGRSLAKAS